MFDIIPIAILTLNLSPSEIKESILVEKSLKMQSSL